MKWIIMIPGFESSSALIPINEQLPQESIQKKWNCRSICVCEKYTYCQHLIVELFLGVVFLFSIAALLLQFVWSDKNSISEKKLMIATEAILIVSGLGMVINRIIYAQIFKKQNNFTPI